MRLNKATTEKYLATSFNEIKLLLVSREWKTIPYTEEVSRILSFYDYDIQVDPATGKLLKVFKAQRFSPDQQAILDKAKVILKGDKKTMKTVAGQIEILQEMYEMGFIDKDQLMDIMIYGSSTVKVDILKDYFTLPPLDAIIVSPPTDCGIEAVPNLLKKEL